MNVWPCILILSRIYLCIWLFRGGAPCSSGPDDPFIMLHHLTVTSPAK